MDWLSHAWEVLVQALNPQTIISVGGLWLLVAVVFAETGLLAGFFLPGDSLLFTAGLLASDPKFQTGTLLDFTIFNVLLFVTLAAILGDSTGYAIGRRGGAKVFNKPKSFFFKPEYVATTRRFFEKHGNKTLILGRFLPIVRTFAPVMAGVVHLHYPRFLYYNIVGGVLWVFSLCLMGYFLGTQFPWIKNYYEYIVIGFVVITTVPVVRMVIHESKSRKRAQTSSQTPTAGSEAGSKGPASQPSSHPKVTHGITPGI